MHHPEEALMKLSVVIAVYAMTTPALVAAHTPSSYAGEESRSIKALSSDDVHAYLSGEGYGMAKAAELNHYPGPKHVLAMAEHLHLKDAQRTRINDIAKVMTANARALGRRLISEDASRNNLYVDKTITDASLEASTGRIATLQGQLRAAHLGAHLATRAVLSDAQVRMYDKMRGYDGGSGMNVTDHHHGH
jgi:hypothetical protein